MDGQVRTLWDQHMTTATLDSQLKSASEIHGWCNTVYSHQFHYGGGQMLDKSRFVSSAQKNVIMNHSSNRTFIEFYCPRCHAGLQEVMCVTRMSQWIDPRRTSHLTDAEKASAERGAELQAAICTRERLIDLQECNPDPMLVSLLQQS
ncbi:hypothetical protein EMCG_06270 [[Emmonsia] crescens]|uniref:Uncharacterized protein n=1 Tax=[Emmonsia] crescens TaxID=73230 RepID=A0A0G2IC04_9EURO|nr:hypothetical protein EMCG_06270 [Emmonsia crescens UAMH 3008]